MREILQKLNFSEKEIDIYLSALKLQSGSISKLAKQARIKRPTTYVILEKLCEMGLISLEKRDNKQVFVCEHPDQLLDLINQKKKKIAKKKKLIQKSLPELQKLFQKNIKAPTVQYFEEKEGVFNIVNDLIASKETAWIIVPGKIYDVFGIDRMMKEVIEKRSETKTKGFLITDHHPIMEKLWRINETDAREIRFAPENIKIDSTIYIYGDKVSLIFFKEPLSGLMIENTELVTVMKFMFQSLWKELDGNNLPK
ncbi:hypothetical protein KAJ41_00750 [Candidatus Parcubacteria bacterium]|nr:hypothetical protein [Candidatus Parcubacteria bacterium]